MYLVIYLVVDLQAQNTFSTEWPDTVIVVVKQ